MARGFGSTLGSGTTDKIVAASYTSPTLFSYAGWVNRNADGTLSAGRIFSKDGSTTGEIAARRSASNVMTLSRKFSTTQGDWTVTGTSLDTAGRWNHLAIVYDGGATGNVPVVYVNGMAVSVATLVTPAGTVTSSAGVLNIGNIASSVREWDGILGDQAFWSGVLLSAAEVEALYNGANPRDIRGNYLQELISMTSLIPASLVKATQPITRGTKIRPDRLVIVPNVGDPFTQALSGAQNLTPSLFTNSNAFYAATVAAGAVDLAPALFSNSNTFYAPTVSPGAVDLTPALFTNSNTFYATTASATYALTPGLFSNSNTFYAATVAAGAIDLTPALFSNTNSFYSATVSLDGASQDIAPALFTNSNAFYAATVSPGAVDISPALFSNSNTFYAPTVSASYTLAPVLFTNSNSFFSPTVQATYALIASIFGNTNTFYSPTVSAGAVDLAPSPLSNINTFYAPVVALDGQIIVVPLYTNTNAFYAAAVEIPISRLTGSRPTSGASRLRTNIQTGTRPAARG